MKAAVGRPRTIDRNAVLDAAQRVVRRDGAARLTLEAVAAEAGISKAGVLYDYKTKQALIRALIERRIELENERHQRIRERLTDSPDSLIRSRILGAKRPGEADREVAVNLIAALAQDDALRGPIQAAFDQYMKEVREDSRHPRGALLALLALEGLKLLEWLGLYSWPEDERERLLQEIRWLVDQSPAPCTDPELSAT